MSHEPEKRAADRPENTLRPGKADPDKAAPHAWRSPLAVIIFLAASSLGLTADLWSKEFVFNRLLADPQLKQEIDRRLDAGYKFTEKDSSIALRQFSPRREVFPGVKLTLSTNPGVVFGIDWLPRAGVLIATILTMGLVGFFFASADRRAWVMHVSLAMIMAGALGNMYDRLFSVVSVPGLPPIKYHVRDFIDCSQLGWRWVFNVADAWLVVGVAGLMLYWIISGRTKTHGPKQSQPA
ncbi:MAG: signal peptidase II [Planctomycetes bacterium]|nr:signal peptidase II [Planctomycetota bacterium]